MTANSITTIDAVPSELRTNTNKYRAVVLFDHCGYRDPGVRSEMRNEEKAAETCIFPCLVFLERLRLHVIRIRYFLLPLVGRLRV